MVHSRLVSFSRTELLILELTLLTSTYAITNAYRVLCKITLRRTQVAHKLLPLSGNYHFN